MIKKLIIITLGILMSFGRIGWAQNTITHGKVTYSVSMEHLYANASEKLRKFPQTEQYFKDIASLAENLKLELTFSGNQSSFQLTRVLNVGEHNTKMNFVQMVVSNGTYYTDLDKKTQILQTQQGREVYNVRSEIKKIKWQLTSEKKKIGDFTCYKAVSMKTLGDNTLREVVAWYAPSIPLAFGPKEYVGSLPGLIMEVQDPVAFFRCTSITLNPKEKITIPFPDEATITTITEEEYRQKGNTAYQMLKKNKP
ncbi:GLPGLI family protein [Ascidiimonas aurantiaca]|uniref:GLPGLI family protein n=1 Tax=Ascidiimonas aurantiaca TaxID=1685432 RepID=UPI0030EEF684